MAISNTQLLLPTLFYLLVVRSFAEEAAATVAARQRELPNNLFCRIHRSLPAKSLLTCFSMCLVKEKFGNCTAVRYLDTNCECGRAMCLDSQQGENDAIIPVLVNLKCDRFKPGKKR